MTGLAPNRYRAHPQDPDRFTTVVWNKKLHQPILCTTYDILWEFDSIEAKDNDDKLFTCTKIDFPLIAIEGQIKPIQIKFKIKASKIDIVLLLPKCYNWQNFTPSPSPMKEIDIFKSDIFRQNLQKCMIDDMKQLETDLKSSKEYIEVYIYFILYIMFLK